MMNKHIVSCLILAGLVMNLYAKPELEYEGSLPRVQIPLSPGDSLQHVVVPEGFHAELYASEPDIINPIALCWDEKGRLCVLQSVDYPHDLKKETGADWLTICEDTDGDGKADLFTRFAENLSLATGVVRWKDGFIVAMAPDMVYLEDTDGDDKADKSTVLFSGFGTFDTHAGPSNLRYLHNNMILGAVGYSAFKGMVSGQEIKVSKGIFQFSTDGRQFDFLGQFNNNTWGSGVSEDLELFGSTANNNHIFHMVIPQYRIPDGMKVKSANSFQSHYEIKTSSTTPLQQVDVRGGYTAAANANVYTARAYPESYWNKMVMICEPTGHVVHHAGIEDDGRGSYIEIDKGNLFASSDDWTAPVYADVGPDGQVWVADWYNPVIQHNPDKRGMTNQIWNAIEGEGNAHKNPRRDKSHGRIYRVVYGDSVQAAPPALRRHDAGSLVKALNHDNMFWRMTAQRLIVQDQVEACIPDLIATASRSNRGRMGINPPVNHALWTLHGLGAITEQHPDALAAAEDALTHSSAVVRKTAVQVLPPTPRSAEKIIASGILADTSARARIMAVLRTSDFPDAPDLKAAVEKSAQDIPAGKWVRDAYAVIQHDQGQDPGESQPAHKPRKHDAQITLSTVPEKMAYDIKQFTVNPGQRVFLTLKNTDSMQHNIVIIKIGTLPDFGMKADAFLTHPDAAKKNYIPRMPHGTIIANSGMLDPGTQEVIVFDAPIVPGDYPYVCTFPGHWRMMQGVMTVRKPSSAPSLSMTSKEDDAITLLMTGGGSSHDFMRWFAREDGGAFHQSGPASIYYTEDLTEVVDKISWADIMLIANNQAVPDDAREAIIMHANKGKGLLINHPGTWYNWKDWPAYNKDLVAGGSRGHDAFGEFEVIVKSPDHPVMKDVPATFRIVDELYHWEKDPDAVDIDVLAVGKSPKSGKEYPVVWVVNHPKAAIVCNTLGHDGKAHLLPAYKQILANSLDFVSKGKQ
jgi:putative membrane-bound dehydrogenase-like protein